MSETRNAEPTRDDIEQLLPWFVTGRLDADAKRAVDGYLQAHPAIRSQLAMIEAEQADVVASNEAVGAPAADTLAKLMARIEGDAAHGSPLSIAVHVVQRVLDWLSDRAALVPVAAAAAIALLLQAGVIGVLLWHGQQPRGVTYQTAAAPITASATDKSDFVLAGFAPGATEAEIEKTLQPLGITIVDGPRAGGIYRLRLAEKTLGETERDILTTALKSNGGVVRFVAPVTP